MRTYQARLAVVDDAPRRAYAAIFSRALRSLHAARHSHRVVSKPRFMREFALTSRQYNAVKFTLDGMESSIVELRPGRIADLQQRIKAVDKKLAKLVDPKPAKTAKPKKKSGGAERVPRTFEELRAQAVRAAQSRAVKLHKRDAPAGRPGWAARGKGRPHICFGSRKRFNAQHHLEANGFDSHADWLAKWQEKQFFVLGSKDESGGCQGCVMTHLGDIGARYNCGSMAQPSAISRSMFRLPTASIICSPRSQRNKRCRTAFSSTTRASAFSLRPPSSKRRPSRMDA
jgi:hypothetical protein